MNSLQDNSKNVNNAPTKRNAQLPQELKVLDQWTCVCRVDGKKQPAYKNGNVMKWGTSANWYKFEEVSHLPDLEFILTPKSEIVGIDFDGCVTNGVIHPLVLDWCVRSGSYAEISESGKGVKLFLKTALPDHKKFRNVDVPWKIPGDDHAGIEVHNWQPFAITGNRVDGCPSSVKESPEVLNEILTRFSPASKGKKAEPGTNGQGYQNFVSRNLDVIEDLADGAIITCPWASEHTTPGDTARIWEGPPHTFHCFHLHCANRIWDDLKQKYEPGAYAKYKPSQPSASNGNGVHPPDSDTITDGMLCSFDADDAGNSDAMNALYGQDFLYCASLGWLHYTGTHWSLDVDGVMVRNCAKGTLRARRLAAVRLEKEPIVKSTKADERRVNGCVNMFRLHVSTSIEVFDSNPDTLNCQNGVIDLRTGEIERHTREQRFTYCLPVAYEEADCPEWLEYLKGVVGGGQGVIDYLQMVAGYSLTGHTNEEMMVYLHGPARSGKGTYAETFMTLLPPPLSTMVDFNSFTAKREGDVSNFDLAPLKPTRMVFASESNRSQSLNPAKIKQLTGGDQIRACFKHKDFFAYRPQFKVLMMSNHPVNGDPEDDALWSRVRVIEFPNSFLGREDKSKKARLKEPDVLKGVLWWAVEGSIKWYGLGAKGLVTPDTVTKTTQTHRAELDMVQQWLDECCEGNEGGWSSNEEVMKSYTAWCKANNVQYPKGPKSLAQSLQGKGYESGKVKKIGDKTRRGVGGLYIYPDDSGQA